MERVYNFSAGPACLPQEVLEKAQKEFISYDGTGMNVMEMSHRSKEYQDIIDTAEADFRELLNVPDNYDVLFLQGGASMQFAMVPLNLMTKYKKVHAVNTGMWSKKAIAEAKKFGEVNIVASSEDKTFSYIPELKSEMFTPDADYVHITSNNTIYGTKYNKIPDVGETAAGFRYVLLYSFRGNQRCGLRPYLRGGAEKYRTCGRDHRHRAQGPGGSGAGGYSDDAQI